MAQDLYDDGAGMESPGAVDSQEPKPSENGEATALIDKAFFGDKELKPGVRCEIEVQKVMDGQVLATKVPESEYKEATEPSAARDEVDEMMA